jgi:NTP pyrophosphatase (non-canonical NTP hydrolase)
MIMAEDKLDARLEIRLTPEQLKKLKSEASSRDISVGSLVRETLELRYAVSREDKLAAVEKLAGLETPVKNWEDLKKEIAQGMIKG